MYPTSTIYEKLRYCRYQVTPVADAPTEGWEQESVYNDTVPCVEYPMRSACEIRRMHMYTDTACEVHVRYVACTCTRLVKTVSSYMYTKLLHLVITQTTLPRGESATPSRLSCPSVVPHAWSVCCP